MSNPLEIQVGGSHYKGFAIQPIEFIHQNDIGFIAGCVIKRIARYNQPTGKGLQDLEKALHELDILIYEVKQGFSEESPYRWNGHWEGKLKEFGEFNNFSEHQKLIIHYVCVYNVNGLDIGYLREAKKQIQSLIAEL